jgi:hypothetical protein
LSENSASENKQIIIAAIDDIEIMKYNSSKKWFHAVIERITKQHAEHIRLLNMDFCIVLLLMIIPDFLNFFTE